MNVSIEGLRPWEYWQMDSEEFDMIREVQGVFRQETKAAQADMKRNPG